MTHYSFRLVLFSCLVWSLDASSLRPPLLCHPAGTLRTLPHKCVCMPAYYGVRCERHIQHIQINNSSVRATSQPKDDDLGVYQPNVQRLSKLRKPYEYDEENVGMAHDAVAVKFNLMLILIGFLLCLCIINFYYRIQRYNFRRYVAARLRRLQHEELLNFSVETRAKYDFPPTYDDFLRNQNLLTSGETPNSNPPAYAYDQVEDELHLPIESESVRTQQRKDDEEESTEADSPPVLYKGPQRYLHV